MSDIVSCLLHIAGANEPERVAVSPVQFGADRSLVYLQGLADRLFSFFRNQHTGSVA